jgi:class 3 adenylate cyclase
VKRRISFASVAVTGLGAFVALAVGVTLYFSAASGVRSTQALIAEQAETHLDALEQRLAARLGPVDAQAEWLARSIAEGRIDLERTAELDLFVLGSLGTTPQVSGIAIVQASGKVRRWSREDGAAADDWSGRAEVREWLDTGRLRGAPGWRAPLWTPVRRVPALLHEVALTRSGAFVGMLGQVVPLARLSEELATFRAEHAVTPFILYGADAVLAHPTLAGNGARTDSASPLVALSEVEDPVLAQLRVPGGWEPLGLRGLKRSQGAHATVAGAPYLYVYREIRRYGPEPWTLGVYLDPVAGGQRAEMLRALTAIGAGFAVLVLAVAVAALAGRRLARPIEALARAAGAVRSGRLEDLAPLPASRIAEFDDAARAFGQMVQGLRERKLVRDTLGQFVPEQVARELLAGGGRLEPIEAKATVLVCDLEEFAALTDALGAHRTIEFLNAYFEALVAIVERHQGVVTQFQGDAILAVFNLPIPAADHGANALRAALEIVRVADSREFAGVRARNRVGLSTGRVVAGAVGSAGRLTYTVHGNAVNLAARLEQMNKDYGTRILLSAKTAERCPGFALRQLPDAAIRGYSEPVALYTLA